MAASRAIRTPAGPIELERADASTLALARRILAGSTIAAARLPLPPGTPFQQACWRAAQEIPRGERRSYLWLAERALSRLGRSRRLARACARAAGQAMRRNPWPLVVPCHRVVASSGALGGFGGAASPTSRRVRLKAWLLARESA